MIGLSDMLNHMIIFLGWSTFLAGVAVFGLVIFTILKDEFQEANRKPEYFRKDRRDQDY